MNIPRKWAREAVILFAIILVALALRLTTFKYPYLMAYDPFHHYKIAEYIVETGEFPFFWELSLAPKGTYIFEPMGLYYVSVLLYKILGPLGFDFFSTFKLTPTIMGLFTIVSVYVLVQHIFNKRTAFFTAVILAVLPGFIYRTASGFYRGDGFIMGFMVLGFYFLLRAMEENIEKMVIFSTAAGLCFGVMSLVWAGYIYGFIIILAFAILYSIMVFLLGKKSKVAIAYIIAAGIGILFLKHSFAIQPHLRGWHRMRDLVSLYYPLSAGVAVFFALLAVKTRSIDVRKKAGIVGFLTLLASVALWKIDPTLISRMIPSTPEAGYWSTVGELQPVNREILWGKYSLFSFLFPLGLLSLLKEFYHNREKGELFVLLWSVASIFLMAKALRFTFIASIPIAMLSAIFLSRVFQGKLGRTLSTLPSRIPRVAAVLLLFGGTFAGIIYAEDLHPHMTHEWYDALNFLKTREEGNVLTWWDYGSWIQGITGFPTVVDTVHGQMGPHREIAQAFLESNQSKIDNLLRKYHVDYVLIPTDIIGQMTNIDIIMGLDSGAYQYPILGYTGRARIRDIPVRAYGNFLVLENGMVLYSKGGKLYAIQKVYTKAGGELLARYYANLSLPVAEGAVYISRGDITLSQLPIRDFLIFIPQQLEDTLLTSLMLLDGRGFDGYELIYSNSQVGIYKPIYDYTRINLETEKLYYKTGEEVKIDVKTKSTKPFDGKLSLKISNPEKKIVFQKEYEINGDSSLNIRFALPSDPILGEYKITAILKDDKNKKIDSLQRYVKII
jgi:dolichyl-diphosphooligosaccharide--protein glycosyltransferase